MHLQRISSELCKRIRRSGGQGRWLQVLARLSTFSSLFHKVTADMLLTFSQAQVQQEGHLEEGCYTTGSSRNCLGLQRMLTARLRGGASKVAALCPGPHTCVYRGPAGLVAGLFSPPPSNFLGKDQGRGRLGWTPGSGRVRGNTSKPSGSSPTLEQVRDNNTEFSFQLGIAQRNWKQTTDSRLKASVIFTISNSRDLLKPSSGPLPLRMKVISNPCSEVGLLHPETCLCTNLTLLTLHPSLGDWKLPVQR